VAERVGQVLLDDNLMELTNGRPFPLKHRAKVRTLASRSPVHITYKCRAGPFDPLCAYKLLTFVYFCAYILFSAQLFFHKAVQNDTLFLSIVNVVDYSILVGFDENTHEVVVGIIDYMRQVRVFSSFSFAVFRLFLMRVCVRHVGAERVAVMLFNKYFA
jgi:hypothetical protein